MCRGHTDVPQGASNRVRSLTGPLVPIKCLSSLWHGHEKDTGKYLESRLVSSEGVYAPPSPLPHSIVQGVRPESGALKEATPTLGPSVRALACLSLESPCPASH